MPTSRRRSWGGPVTRRERSLIQRKRWATLSFYSSVLHIVGHLVSRLFLDAWQVFVFLTCRSTSWQSRGRRTRRLSMLSSCPSSRKYPSWKDTCALPSVCQTVSTHTSWFSKCVVIKSTVLHHLLPPCTAWMFSSHLSLSCCYFSNMMAEFLELQHCMFSLRLLTISSFQHITMKFWEHNAEIFKVMCRFCSLNNAVGPNHNELDDLIWMLPLHDFTGGLVCIKQLTVLCNMSL